MSVLSRHQVVTMTRAAVMLPTCGEVLSDHERRMVLTVCGRFAEDHRTAFVTAAEMAVLEEVADAMARALKASTHTVAEDAAGVRAGSSQPAA